MSLAVAGTYGLKVGTPQIKAVGPITFGPEGVLFVADNVGATIFAIEVGHQGQLAKAQTIDVENLDTRLAAFLGCSRADVSIRDMAVQPSSDEVYLSVMRGSGSAALPVLVKVAANGTLSEVLLENVPFSQTAIESAPTGTDTRTGQRIVAVTDMSYMDGVLLVAGMSNEEFSSALRRIPFPFQGAPAINSLEIYHVSHARYETASPIRTFTPYDNNKSILASYTCTPVVRFSVTGLKAGEQVKGKTIAELGAGNTPIDIVSFKRGTEEFLLVSNTKHPLMKLACKDIDKAEALTQPKEPVGVPRQTLPQQGVGKMANLNGSHVLMLQTDEAGVHMRSYAATAL